MAFANANLQNKVSEYSQTADKSDKSENKISEETQDGKIDYLANQSSASLNLIRNKYELEPNTDISFFLSHPPFSPPKS